MSKTIAVFGAGPGMGRSVARRFGREGFRVALVARNQERLAAFTEELAGDGIDATRLAEERADAMDYYLGHMRKDMPAQDGRSRAVSTDGADTIEGLMPQLMDTFAGCESSRGGHSPRRSRGPRSDAWPQRPIRIHLREEGPR